MIRDRFTLVLLLGACAAPAPAPETMPVRAYPESAVAQHPDSVLRAELLAMGEQDQAVRAGLSPETFQDTAFLGRILRTDSALSLRLREIMDEHGWPDAERVGADAVHAAFLIAQHSPFHELLGEVLPHVERDVRAGDDVLIRGPVEDPANLDRRRAELGLMPIADYERMMSEFYQAEVRSE